MTRREWLMAGLLLLLAALSLLVPRCADAALPTGYYGRAVLTTPTLGDTYYDTPVLFRADVGNFPRMDGDAGDIRVYTLAGNMMPHEISEITADSVTIWFEADTLSTGRQFYVYSGNDSPPTALDPSATWDTAAAVFHYDEVPANGATLDDSAGNTDAYASGDWLPSYKTSGSAVSEVGSAWFNDNFRGVHVPDLNVTGDWTIMAWLRPVGNSTDVIAQGNPWWWFVSAQASNTNPQPSFVARYGTWNVSYAYTGCANDGTTALYAVTFTTDPDTAITVYRNGVECTNSAIYEYGGANFGSSDISGWYQLGYDIDLQGQNFTEGRTPFGIASQSFVNSGNQQDQYNGFVDEYAIYTSALSAEQIADMYANQLEPNAWWDLDYHFNLTAPTVAEQIPAPNITTLTGTRTSGGGGTFTIVGTNFGSLDLANVSSKGVGPYGFIETLPIGTNANNLAADFKEGESSGADPATISAERSLTGSQSIDGSLTEYVAPAARGVTYAPTDSFTTIYASWWQYFQPRLNSRITYQSQLQTKQWFITPIADIHSGCGATNSSSNFTSTLTIPSLNATGGYRQTFSGRDGSFSGSWANGPGGSWVHNLPVSNASIHASNIIYSFLETETGAAPSNHWQLGEWVRFEVYATYQTSIDVYDGTMLHWVTNRTTGGGRRIAMDSSGLRMQSTASSGSGCTAGVFIGKWVQFGIFGFYDMPCKSGAPNCLVELGFQAEDGYQPADFFWDEIHMQTGSQARVEVGDNRVFSACSRSFIQYPLYWHNGTSSDEVRFEFNPGDFTDDTILYAFVISENGQVSAGRPILWPKGSIKPVFREGE